MNWQGPFVSHYFKNVALAVPRGRSREMRCLLCRVAEPLLGDAFILGAIGKR